MWLIVIVSLVLLIVTYYFFIKNKQYVVKDDRYSYKSKEFLLSKTEKVVYDTFVFFIHRKNLDFQIFPKVRLTDFLWSPKDNRNAYLRINGKFVDFLIVEKPRMNPVFAVFIINDENKTKMFSLNIIKPVLQSAGIKLIEIPSKIVFNYSELNAIVENVLEEYNGNKSKTT